MTSAESPQAELLHTRVSTLALRSLYSTEVAARRGLAVVEFGDILALSTPADDPDSNRVLGVGLTQAASAELLDRIDRFYRLRNSPYSIQLHPSSRPIELPQQLEALRMRPDSAWTVLARSGDAPDSADTGEITVKRIRTKAERRQFGELMARSFGLPLSQAEIFSAVVGRDGWLHYLAYFEAEPIAAAWMYVIEGAALLAGSGTLPEWRCRGAQRALTVRRLRDVPRTLAFIETQMTWREDPPAELRNAARLGFRRAFELQSYRRTGDREPFDATSGRWQ